MRTHADTLTIAFIAIGAQEALKKSDNVGADLWGGHMEFIAVCTDHSLALDQRADEVDYNDGAFAYEIAERFGEDYATACIEAGVRLDPEKFIRELLPDPRALVEVPQ